MSRTYRLQGFIIKRRNWRDHDRMITVFSRQKGKVCLKAKGVRRLQSRRAGLLEQFNEVTFLAARGRAGDIITEVSLDHNYGCFAQDYSKTRLAYQLIELVDKLAPENEYNLDLYELLALAFNYLESRDFNNDQADRVLLRFKIRILDLLGFGVPRSQDLENMTAHIENILEKKLMTKDCYDI